MARLLPFALSALLLTPASLMAEPLDDAGVARASREAVFGDAFESEAGVARLRAGARPEALPALALALRYRGASPELLAAMSTLAGEPIRDWGTAMRWIEARPDVPAHPSYRAIKLDLYDRIDPEFRRFLGDDMGLAANMDIRLEEIVWGGVRVDGIPSLDEPAMIDASAAVYLKEDDRVFGIAINGDVRAYPLRIMGWHEMFNATIGGVPVALAYCTLCGAAILYETAVEGRPAPLIFGSSGLLYRSNKLMFDRATESLWNQFTGEPVAGPLRGSGIRLAIRPAVTTTWGAWRKRHPKTRVLSLETGHKRDYGSGVVYQDYFASPDLMFPAIVRDESVAKRKDVVFGIRDVAAARAWPVEAFRATPIINDAVGARSVVLIGDAEAQTVRAYDRGSETFGPGPGAESLTSAAGAWRVEETALIGPNGQTLARIPGHLSYWFAWDSYLGVASTLYGGKP